MQTPTPADLHIRLWLAALLLAGPGALAEAWSASATHEQTITLVPGWNAVYLEVQPEPNDIESVTAGIPVTSLWRWIPRGRDASKFIADPAEDLRVVDGWYRWFPRSGPNAFLTDLFTLQANRSYLVELGGSNSVDWRIRGKPRVRRQRWRSDSFNLKGFHVEPANPPTFGAYFEGASAHEGQPVFRLSATGYWEPVGDATQIDSGRAYWVYVQGPSSFQGPLEVSLEASNVLDFGASESRRRLTLRSPAGVATDITVRRLGPDALPMAYRRIDPDTGMTSWPPMPQELSLPVNAKGTARLKLAVKRAEFTEGRMEQVLAVTDGLGSRILVHAGANTIQPRAPFRQSQARSAGKQSPTADAYDVEKEAFHVSRIITLDFSQSDPLAGNDPDLARPEWGSSIIGGNYEEIITGVHRDEIHVAGTFELRRVSAVAELNSVGNP